MERRKKAGREGSREEGRKERRQEEREQVSSLLSKVNYSLLLGGADGGGGSSFENSSDLTRFLNLRPIDIWDHKILCWLVLCIVRQLARFDLYPTKKCL